MRAGLLQAAVTAPAEADGEARPGRHVSVDDVFAMRYLWVSTNTP